MEARRPQLLPLMLVLCAAACSPAPPGAPSASGTPAEEFVLPAAEPTPGPQAPAPDLRKCPPGDAPWAAALRRAGRDGSFEQLLSLAETVAAEHPERWEPRWIVAECHYRSGRVLEAAQSGELALALAKTQEDPVGIALSAYRCGWLEFRSGELAAGAGHYEEALRAAEGTGRKDLLAQIENGLAGLLVELGRYAEAHQHMERAVSALEELGLAPYARRTALNRAVILMLLGDALSAGRALEEVYEKSVASEDTFVLARAALTLGNLHRRLGEEREALDWYARVPEGDSELASLASLSRGLISTRLRNYGEAASHLDRATSHASPVDQLLIEAHRAEIDIARGDAQSALLRLDEVIPRAEAMGAENVVWIARWLAGRAWIAAGRLEEAAVVLRDAVSVLDRQGAALNPMEEGLRFLRERSDVYSDLAAALCGDGVDSAADPRAQEILDAVEATHARALRQLLSAGGLRPGAAKVVDVQTGLEDGELLVDFAIGRQRGVVVAIGRDAFLARRIPGWDELAEPLRRYRAALVRPLRSAEARLAPGPDLARSIGEGWRLSRELLDPIRPLLEGATRIYVVPDRELALLPFAALPWDRQPSPGGKEGVRFLGELLETAVMPLAGQPVRERSLRPGVLLAGDPLPGPSLPPLPLAGQEIESIRSLWGRREAKLLRGESLRLDRLRQELAGAGTLHLATHAEASTSDPARCAVFLSGGETLGIDAIRTLPLESSLVVLSACNTGRGELVPGEGVIGLAWAFLEAGADTVSVSLWQVEDRAAAELMLSFHRFLKAGDDPLRAMSRARRLMARERRHPAFWAPFVMISKPL